MTEIHQATATSIELVTTEKGEVILWHRPKGQGVVFMLINSKLSLNLPEDHRVPTNTLTYTYHFDNGDLSCMRTAHRWDSTSSEVTSCYAVQKLIQAANGQPAVEQATYI